MATNYIATAVDFTTVADAIRAKGGTSASLSWPAGFAAAISAIPTSGGGDELFNQMVTRTPFASLLQVVSTSYVGSGAFAWYHASNVALSFPNATAISNYAFHNASFEQLTFPNCTTIGSHAFNNYQDDNITFTKMSVVPTYAFYSASFSTMTDSMFPSATIVQSSACRYAASLTTVSLSKVVSAYQYAFANCAALTNVSLPSLKGTLGIAAFTGCTALTTITLPNVGVLLNTAFQGCISLTAVYLPKCTKISSTYAFRSCYHLLSLYLLNSTMVTLTSTNAFISTPISTYTTSTGGVYGSIYVPSDLLASYKAAANWSKYSARFVGLTSSEIAALGF